MESKGNCWNCGQPLGELDYGRGDVCSKCGRDTRVCKGCDFFDTSANRSCREPQADLVTEKERSNFCDYFRPKFGQGAEKTSRDAMKAVAAALFKK